MINYLFLNFKTFKPLYMQIEYKRKVVKKFRI